MRKPLIAGNWKMNASRNDALALATTVAQAPRLANADVVIFPPFLWLEAVARAISGSNLGLGGQDCSAEDRGAYTGQISAPMLTELCDWVIVGHSERRRDAAESDALVGRKARAALLAGLRPIVCVGEAIDARESGRHEHVVGGQVEAVLAEVSDIDTSTLVWAYEPIWAIGTGRSASPSDAQAMAAYIRSKTRSQLGEDVRILYGGSVVPENATTYLSEPDVDGLLVGGASLKADQFLAIIEAC